MTFSRPPSLLLVVAGLVLGCRKEAAPVDQGEVVAFASGDVTLHGVLFKPAGAGPFPAVLYNHGSFQGTAYREAFEALGSLFTSHGFVLFVPYRRGQGLSADAGRYVIDEINAARQQDGVHAAAVTMMRRLEGDQLDDQVAGLAWLRRQPFVAAGRVAVAGNSFGGIETVLGAERETYCAAVDASGGAETWAKAPELRASMLRAARAARCPVLFFQAANDYDLSPSQELSAAMRDAGKQAEVKIYPAFGDTPADGHSFTYRGSAVWGDDVVGFLNRHCAK
jgi:carboxymethylenebutenolidase